MRLILKSLLGLFFFLSIQAQAKFKTPWLSGPVIDEVGILSPADKAQVEQLLFQMNENKIAQVQVFITSSLQGLPIEQASIEIADQWKLGDAKKDNGLLFLIAPNERKVRIEVGQGLEGIIPDVYAKRINEDIVVPYFRQGQMSTGIVKGVKAISSVIAGEQIQEQDIPQKRDKHKVAIPFWAIILLWLFVMFIGRMGGGRGGGTGFLLGTILGSSGRGGRGGGFGGGGWSGGGGGFSGGGSSSSW